MVLKPKLNASVYDDSTGKDYLSYSSSNNTALIIYFFMVVLTQFGVNASIVVNKCGGSISQNIGSAFLITLIPWVFIFGGIIVCLLMFPGFKSAFSNVVGYFAVSKSANDTLTTLLENTDLNNTISSATEEQKSAAEAIIKLCGNISIIINQIVPSNFGEYWTMLTSLMKPQYQNGSPELKQKLLDSVVMRDNIGEALWYFYSAVLLISITQYNISSKKCAQDLATLKANQEEYQKKNEKMIAESNKEKSTVYTL